jgi:hypothetical protein
MDEKYKFWLGAGLNAAAWVYLILSVIAVAVAAYGRFLARVPGNGMGIYDALILLLALAVAGGGFWLLRFIANRLVPSKQ